ncbi:MAG TPA: hypothetical protein VGR08_03785, partial [Thermomicrobiales bacterium]|nr:hypothetical protein [Thermomicrobiales bacterium]
QETRGWVDAEGKTVAQRTKEQAHDYRYFPEPDLPPLQTSAAVRETIRGTMPELPHARQRRFVESFGLAPADASVLSNERAIADVFESAATSLPTAAGYRSVANWMVNDIMGLARARSLPPDQLPLSAEQIAGLVTLVTDGSMTGRAAKDLLPLLEPDEAPFDAAERLNLRSIDDADAVSTAVDEAIAAHPGVVADYKGGKRAALGRLIGESMKRTEGRAKPDAVRAALISRLDS